MITNFNTNAPSTPGKSGGGLGTLFTVAVIGLALYLGYKYFIKPQPIKKEE